jgi:hypothetical protein
MEGQQMTTKPMPIDALRRFTPTEFTSTVELNGATVMVATNNQFLADRLCEALAFPAVADSPVFSWRVVVEPDGELEFGSEPLSSHRLSHDGLAFVSIGQRNFFACDLQAREGVSFISERFVYDKMFLHEYFVPTLISLLKESLDAPS